MEPSVTDHSADVPVAPHAVIKIWGKSRETLVKKIQSLAYCVSKAFSKLYQKDYEITGGGLIQTFQGMEVEQPDKVIKLTLTDT